MPVARAARAGPEVGDIVHDAQLGMGAGPAGLRVEQPVVECPAEASDDARNPVDPVGVDIVAATEGADVILLDIGAQIGALDTDDQPGDLIVASELTAANEARRVIRVSLAREKVAEAGRVHAVGVFRPGVAATNCAADIAAG